MDSEPDDRTISLKLAEVLSEIGVNKKTVKVRRKSRLLQEHSVSFAGIFTEGNAYEPCYYFGSQSEGTTTLGLESDVDTLYVHSNYRVIQDWSEWTPGVVHLLMVRDGTSPGYCLLQLLRRDTPLPETLVADEYYIRDEKGRVLIENTIFHDSGPGLQQNGPATTLVETAQHSEYDVVPALYCESWPIEGQGWLNRQSIGNWPSRELKRMAASKGCFLVPVGSKCNNLGEVEWRISTSLAERLMMFDLNITQIMCYVMMKVIKKEFLTMNGVSIITSFMCKCILFRCIENMPMYYWCDDNLFACVMECITNLGKCVQSLNCPHYIIPNNNLMANRINPDQQDYLIGQLRRLLTYKTLMLYVIRDDWLGCRLKMKLANVVPSGLPSQFDYEREIVFSQHLMNVRAICASYRRLLEPLIAPCLLETTSRLVDGIQKLCIQYYLFSDTAVEAYTYYFPLLCSLVGSILASFSVHNSNTVSQAAICWLTAGFDSDVASSRLKLASAFYCSGDINNAELTLREIEQRYSQHVVPVCGCRTFDRKSDTEGSIMHVYRNNGLVHKTFAFCVKFLRCESPIIPRELRRELFRCTEDETLNKSEDDKLWVDLACIDSLPYLYFLQYKVYKQLGRVEQQKKALSNLLKTNRIGRNCAHRETAWNLLGQCKEQENKPVEALNCYQKSLKVRPDNNVANFLILPLQRRHSHVCQLS